MNLAKLIDSFKFKKFSQAVRADFVLPKAALMLAAVDGEVVALAERGKSALDEAIVERCSRARRFEG